MFPAYQTTAYDLNFRLLGFPVRVHPLFWLVILMLGPTNLETPRIGMLIAAWVMAAFASLLVHELGHALAFRFFGCQGTQIWLYWFGGLAFANARPASPGPNIAISLAGPVLQLALAAAAYGGLASLGDNTPMFFNILLLFLVKISLFWAILNLLPIWPLDGGQVLREACHLTRVPRPLHFSLAVSVLAALSVAGLGLIVAAFPSVEHSLPDWMPVPSLFGVLLFGALAYSSYEMIKSLQD